MGDVGDFLFGESEDAKQVGTAQTMAPEQRAFLNQLIGILGGTPKLDSKGKYVLDPATKLPILSGGQLGQGVEAYPGELVPGATDIQSGVFDQIKSMLGSGSLNAGGQTAQDAIAKIMGGTTDVPTVNTGALESWWKGNVNEEFPTYQSITDYWGTTVKDPAIKAWQEDVLPVLKENFIAQNAGSSSGANRAITRSGEDLMSSLGSDLSQRIFDAQNQSANRLYESNSTLGTLLSGLEQGNVSNQFTAGQNDLSRLLNIPGLSTGVDTSNINNLLATLGIGTEQRNIEGQQATSDYNQWLATQPYNNPWLNLINTAINSSAIQPIVQGPTQTQGFLQSILGSMGGTDFSGFMSKGTSGGSSGGNTP